MGRVHSDDDIERWNFWLLMELKVVL
jgi:hypothetical protein